MVLNPFRHTPYCISTISYENFLCVRSGLCVIKLSQVVMVVLLSILEYPRSSGKHVATNILCCTVKGKFLRPSVVISTTLALNVCTITRLSIFTRGCACSNTTGDVSHFSITTGYVCLIFRTLTPEQELHSYLTSGTIEGRWGKKQQVYSCLPDIPPGTDPGRKFTGSV